MNRKLKKTLRKFVANNDIIRIVVDMDDEESTYFCDDLYHALSDADLFTRNIEIVGVTEEVSAIFEHDVLDRIICGVPYIREVFSSLDCVFSIFVSDDVDKRLEWRSLGYVCHTDCIALETSSMRVITYILIRNQIERKLKPSWNNLKDVLKKAVKKLLNKE